jgi:hypothetical protein
MQILKKKQNEESRIWTQGPSTLVHNSSILPLNHSLVICNIGTNLIDYDILRPIFFFGGPILEPKNLGA